MGVVMADRTARIETAGGGAATAKLSVMMFLQFFLWGAWFVVLGPYMKAHGMGGDKMGAAIGNAYTTAPVAAIVAPVFLGMVADRLFPSQIVMAVLHILGGLLLCAAPSVAAQAGDNPWPFIGVLLAHMLCYMPTLGLSNTVAFNAMSNPEKQFPVVRVWGTIGWIVAGVIVGFAAKQLVPEQATEAATEVARNGSPHFFYIAGASGVLLGLFSLALPHTPPPLKGKPVSLGSLLGLDALSLLARPSFAVFILCSLLICIPLAAYYAFAATYVGDAGVTNVPFKMTFGQMSEIGFMLVMPLFFRRLGVKWMLAVGMLAWVVRYALFAAGWQGAGNSHIVGMVLAGVILHGICYDFFFVTGQIYTERAAPKEIRAQAQGFLVLITQGVGMLIGNLTFGRFIVDTHKDAAGVVDWRTVWMFPAAFAGGVLLLFLLAFRDKGEKSGA
jgi:nucleoside transporter